MSDYQEINLFRRLPDGNERWAVSNRNVVVLYDTYSPDQLWLPCVDVIFKIKQPKEKAKIGNKPKVDRKLTPFCPHTVLNPLERDVHQMILPFSECQVPSKAVFANLVNTDFPAFERDENGLIYATRLMNITQGDIKKWVKENCFGRVAIKNVAVFERREDFILAIVSGFFYDFRGQFHTRLPS